jgi:hypothetical protein
MSAVNATSDSSACPCGKPVKVPAAYCSIPCKRRAQNTRAAEKRRGVLSCIHRPQEGRGVLTPFPDRLSPPATRPQWKLGAQLGALPDPRKYVAKLYPDGEDPSNYSNQRAFACHVTDHRVRSRVGWYGLVLGKAVAVNGWAFETGPHRTVDEAVARVELWLAAPVQKRPDGNLPGHFLATISSAPSGAASVARGALG